MASSEGCLHQAFAYGNRVVGLQFHLESSEHNIQNLIQHCREDLTEGLFIQSEEVMTRQESHVQTAAQLLYTLLDNLVREAEGIA